jgi:hypothetical protein
MLNELTRITNAPEFLRYGNFFLVAIQWQPHASSDLILRLELVLEAPPTYDTISQQWEVRCRGSLGGNLNSLVQPTLQPYTQLRVLDRHPVLFDYDSRSTVLLEGTCSDVVALIGALYVAHEQACGHWVPFHDLFGHLPTCLAKQQAVSVEIPSGLLDVYRPVFTRHGLHHHITHELRSRYDGSALHHSIMPGQVLLFSNPLVSDTNQNAGQPYQVAEAFEEVRIR